MKTFCRSLMLALSVGAAAPVASAQAPCSTALDFNWDNPLVGIWEFQDVWKRCVLVENPHPYPIQICKAAMRFQHNLGLLPVLPKPSVFYSWAQAIPLGNAYVPGLAIGSVTTQITIPFGTTMTQRGTFVQPLVLPPGQKVYLVANFYIPPLTVGGDWISSTLTHSSNNTHSWYWKNGYWNQSLVNGYHYQLTYRPWQAGSVTSLGGGCSAAGGASNEIVHASINSTALMIGSSLEPGALAFHMVGWSDPNVPLDGLGAPGCRVRSSAEVLYPGFVDSVGELRNTIALPNDPAIIGLSLFTQCGALDAWANQLGLSFSNGSHAIIGSY